MQYNMLKGKIHRAVVKMAIALKLTPSPEKPVPA